MSNKKKVGLTSSGINANIPNVGFAKSLNEYIWNGFDAGASIVKVLIDRNGLGGIDAIRVIDNGNGINFNTLAHTFEPFSDSLKINKDVTSDIKGEKGKGRFYFKNFCRKAEWKTVYQDPETKLNYIHTISIDSIQLNLYDSPSPVKTNNELGTEVIFTTLDMSEYSTDHTNMAEQLACEFGAFLYLHEDKKFKIVYDSEIVTYKHLISNSHTEEREIDGNKFKITYLQWNKKISDRCFVYYFNNDHKKMAQHISRYDDHKTKFYHSVYIESDFYNKFEFHYSDKNKYKPDYYVQTNLNTKENNNIYITLNTILNELLTDKHKIYFSEFEVNSLIEKYKTKGILPNINSDENKYHYKQAQDLIFLVKEVYTIEPTIFKTLNDTQAKTMVGLFNLLLTSDSRDELLEFLSGYIKMTEYNKKVLHNLLKMTSLENIIHTAKMIIDRLDAIERLKILIFELTKFTTERKEIQKIIENNYWLFGEEFNLVASDKTFNQSLYNYLISEGKNIKKSELEEVSNKRPDILICSDYNVSGNNSAVIEENIIVELKRPTVKITMKEYRQMEDYKDLILSNSNFKASNKRWKFYLIGKEIDSLVKKKYDTVSNRGIKGLTESDSNSFEMYVLSWEDLFTSFRIKYRHILNKLGVKEIDINQAIERDPSKTEKEIVSEITSKIIHIDSKTKKDK